MTKDPSEIPLPILDYVQPEPPDLSVNGPCLVMRIKAEFPMRCVKCNQPADRCIRKRFLWANTGRAPAGGAMRLIPFVRIFFAFQSMILWFVDLRTSRTLVLNIPVCPKHYRRNQILTLAALLAFSAGLSLLFFPVGDQLHLWGPVLGFFTAAILLTRPRPLTVVHVGLEHVTLAGVGSDYLNAIATMHGRPITTVTDMMNSTEELRQRIAAKKLQ